MYDIPPITIDINFVFFGVTVVLYLVLLNDIQ